MLTIETPKNGPRRLHEPSIGGIVGFRVGWGLGNVAAYGFLRFIGGGLAPWAAGVLAERFGVPLPFYLGAAAVLLAAGVLATGHHLLARADEALAAAEAAHAGENDLDAAELREVTEDGTGEAGARVRAEVPPPTR